MCLQLRPIRQCKLPFRWLAYWPSLYSCHRMTKLDEAGLCRCPKHHDIGSRRNYSTSKLVISDLICPCCSCDIACNFQQGCWCCLQWLSDQCLWWLQGLGLSEALSKDRRHHLQGLCRHCHLHTILVWRRRLHCTRKCQSHRRST